MNAVQKQSKCPICRSDYVQFSSLDPGCSAECKAEVRRQKHRKRAAKDERRATREALEKMLTARNWMPRVQAEFNKYIRLRDAFLPCISCGAMSPPQLHGGAWDCGHYRTVAAAPELRFEELNAHKQCKGCNGGKANFSKRRSTVDAQYRVNLIQRIGLEKVEWLEGPYEAKRYRVEELIGLRDHYRAKIKHLKFLRETKASFA